MRLEEYAKGLCPLFVRPGFALHGEFAKRSRRGVHWSTACSLVAEELASWPAPPAVDVSLVLRSAG